jgi:hypothetical protein
MYFNLKPDVRINLMARVEADIDLAADFSTIQGKPSMLPDDFWPL